MMAPSARTLRFAARTFVAVAGVLFFAAFFISNLKSMSRGKSLFFGKARCSQCHTLAGTGGFIASDLSSYARTRAPEEIRQAIVNPNSVSRAAVATVVTTRDGYKYSGAARNEDNFSLQLQTPDGAFHLFLKSELASVVRDSISLMPPDYP